MKNQRKTVGLTLVALSAFTAVTAPVNAQETQDDLREQIRQLDQNLRILERKLELKQETEEAQAAKTPVLSAGPSGFVLRSADTNFLLRVRGGVQMDARIFPGQAPANDTLLLRRVRPALEGTVYQKYDYRIMLDVASGVSSSAANNGFLIDAYANARFLPWFQVQAGKFKEPVGLERLQSYNNLLFIERGFPTQLLPNRDVGVQVHGEVLDGRLNYALGVFNGVEDGASGDFDAADEEKDVAGRVFSHPFKTGGPKALRGLGLGVGGSYGERSGALRNYVTPGQQRFFGYNTGVVGDGSAWRFTPQGYYYWGAFGLLAEYAISSHRVTQTAGPNAGASSALQNKAWQVAVSYFLTGEKNSFRAVEPLKPFNPAQGGMGAWEITARVGEIDIDDGTFPIFAGTGTSVENAFSWGAGLNWHLNRNVKLQLNYEHTQFSGGEAAAITAQDEHVILTRAQITF